MRQVWHTVAQFHMLEPGDRVLIGVSGGPDSVALLHLLHSKAVEYGIQLYVVHINHMLRPEAETEARYVEHLAEQYAIPFRLYKINVKEYADANKLSLEQAGHVVRFQCFQDAKSVWKINKLALGHHKNDRAESVLLHMVQGCGTEGLTAMPPIDVWEKADNSSLIRPLAEVHKSEILQYCMEHALEYYIDATNLETDYLRNRIRLELLPNMMQYNPQIVDALVRLQDICSAELDYVEQQTASIWKQYGLQNEATVQFPAEVFRTLHIAVQRRILRHMYSVWTGSTMNLSFAQIEQMRQIAQQSNGTQTVSISGETLFVRQYNTLKFAAKEQFAAESQNVVWNIHEQPIVQIWNGTVLIEQDVSYNKENIDKHCIYADFEKLSERLTVRTRTAGDTLVLSGLGGHKTIKKFFIDRKIPKEVRDTLPIVLSGEEIVWIPGVYVNDSIRITTETKRVCKLCFSHA